MPIIEFGERDILRGKVIDPGWYLMKIESIGEALAKNGNSTNYPVEGTIVKNADNGSTDFAGVPVDWNFNSKAIGFATNFLLAFGIQPVVGKRFELNDAAGKTLDVFVENGQYNGRVVNRVEHKYRASQ